MAYWLQNNVPIASVAAQFELFEGNVQKALMKLNGLLEEFQAMATLSGNVEWLDKLTNSKQMVLRDVILSESLYLRL